MKKIAVVTGAAGGLGKEIVRRILDDVDELWAVGRNLSKLDSLKAELGVKIVPLQMDLSDTKSYDVLKSRLSGGEYEVFWLVNNAGSGRFGPSAGFTLEELSAGITSHCTAMASLCNICIPYMKKGSFIMNTASQSAFLPLPYMNLYAATKAFVYSYTRALRIELKDSGISVTAVCPGWIKTALLPEKLNGKTVNFPFLTTAEKVAKKAVKAARKRKPLMINSLPVRFVSWMQRHLPQEFAIKTWARMVRKYV